MGLNSIWTIVRNRSHCKIHVAYQEKFCEKNFACVRDDVESKVLLLSDFVCPESNIFCTRALRKTTLIFNSPIALIYFKKKSV